MNASWSVPASAMVKVPLLSQLPHRVCSQAGRIGFSGEMPMLCDGGDEVVRPRVCLRTENEAGVRLTVRQCQVDPAGAQQMPAAAQRQDRLAMPMLVLAEFEPLSIALEGADRVVAIGKHQCVVEHGRRLLQADIHLDLIARGWLHRTE